MNRLPGFTLTPDIAAAAVTGADWPGRLQRLTRGPFAEALGPRALWLDGGHNPAAGSALAETLKDWPARPHVIVGMLGTKDAAGYLTALGAAAASLHTIAVPGAPSTLEAEALAATARSCGLDATAHASLDAAVAAVGAHADAAPILIAGSLYLAGAVLADHG